VIRLLAVTAIVLASGRPAHADPSERSDADRAWHFTAAALGGATYLVVELAFKQQISRARCWWCDPPRFDARMRTLKWENVDRANNVSNLTGFVLSPLFAIGGLVASSAFDDQASRRMFDDVIPVLQAGIATGLVNEALKIAAARQRPYARFGGKDVMQRPGESYTSFFSGHAALDFAMAASAGTVASLRGYDTAPVLWGGGLALAFLTSYLRIASDTHYLTDVVFGAIVGSALGVAIPRLLHEDVLTDEPASTARSHVERRSNARQPVILSFGRAF
jgi:membrane-associated phospholipid phosphatase